MQSLWRSALRLCRRPSALARRQSEEKQVRLDRITKGMGAVVAEKETEENLHDSNPTIADVIYLEGSSHRDAAIYKKKWERCYDMDMADRNETVSNLMKFSEVSDCYPDQEICIRHLPGRMMQIFSLKLVETPINSGSIQLYGYMAVRDDLDGLLNYVFNHSRDDPVIAAEIGSLIQMTGPKRGILMLSDVLLEFDMRIKTGENGEDDIQLIDGLIHYDDHMAFDMPFTSRISGNCSAVDMSFAVVEIGLEAIIEVAISEVQSAFHLSLCSFAYVGEVRKEIQLFHGAAAGEMGIRSVVAIPIDTTMHLKFSVGQKGSGRGASHCCSFGTKLHGCTNRQIKLEMACISMKVTWRPPLSSILLQKKFSFISVSRS
ncbi:hypothetical protein EJB05_34309 [Eragrostis curvula]|uniref:DUF6598 domain-containing protein n=1 Tax=Eragrostis curvula TaxID=38414 RepID=A0A5J9U3I0_9POAL|nr:hypothetical protein EJB05_34309 [Eragrostis curvula]